MRVRNRNLLRFSKGLSLIEVLIVITILASLIMLALINGPRFITKAHDARRKSDLAAYKIAFEHHYEDRGCYPALNVLDSCGAPDDTLKPYLPKMLCDPQTREPYVFDVVETGCADTYKIFTYLSNADDPDIERIGCTLGCGIIGVDESFQYGVSSSNTRVGDPMGLQVGGSDGSGGGDEPTSNPAGASMGGGSYYPLNCALQQNGTWACQCTVGGACGLGCPGNTICSADGTFCFVDTIQCPIGPQ